MWSVTAVFLMLCGCTAGARSRERILAAGLAVLQEGTTRGTATRPRERSLTEGQVVLQGGTARGTGNVLVVHEGRLWTVCDDGWDLRAANVACRSLGYSHALGHTSQSYFGQPNYEIGLDNVQCHGDEISLLACQHEPFSHHDCDKREAAGVFCSRTPLRVNISTTDVNPTNHVGVEHRPTSTSTSHSFTTATPSSMGLMPADGVDTRDFEGNEVYREAMELENTPHPHRLLMYDLRIVNGRNVNEGRLEVNISGEWGVVCSDHWTLLEARVACKQAGLGFAQTALLANYFGGEDLTKLAAGIHCDGEEELLSECYHQNIGAGTSCRMRNMVAGVVCARELPDLVPNATLLEKSTYLQDQPMYYMQCALEENCASSSAFVIKSKQSDWHIYRRRLLRFSSSIWNFGTSDFRPALSKQDWEWHLCHMHYHSMKVFANYDILDPHGNQLAEGHKASFCLEDVQCTKGVVKKFACKGFGDQGISVGCADDYLHDIDCQWIDITDVKPGKYIFRMHINPEYNVAELSYNNNAAICNLAYSGFDVKVTNCTIGRG